jgi:hypothetical protein
MSILYKLSVGVIFTLFFLMGTLQANNRTNTTLPNESSAFQCLLNIPMGISPAELNEYLAKCPNLKMFDYEGNAMSNTLDLSAYNGQYSDYLHGQELVTIDEDSLHRLTFSFLNGGLYSIFYSIGNESDYTVKLIKQLQSLYGKASLSKEKVFYYGSKVTETSYNWRVNTNSITLSRGGEDFVTIQNDSIAKIASDFSSTSVQAIVYTYNGYDKKKKLTERQWHSEHTEQTQQITTQCEGIGKITLKGSGNNITCKILCQDGKVVFEKKGINVKGNKEVLVLKEFPSNCEEVFAYKRVEGDVYTTYYTLVLEKNGIELFKGIIDTQDCVE